MVKLPHRQHLAHSQTLTFEVAADIVGVEADKVTETAGHETAAHLRLHHLVNRSVQDAKLGVESTWQ